MPAGRPTSYKKEYADQAYRLCLLLGATDVQLADYFGVTEKTINVWKAKHPEFIQSLKDGKEKADSKIAESLYKRGLGYSHPEDKVFCYEGEIITHETIKHYPPDTGAAMAWLKNRQPKVWRDKQDVEVHGLEGLAQRMAEARLRADSNEGDQE